jgi:hypothetical protein
MCPLFWKLSVFLILSNRVHETVVSGIKVATEEAACLLWIVKIRVWCYKEAALGPCFSRNNIVFYKVSLKVII